MLEALWLHQYHNVVERRPAEAGCSTSPDFRARAAATRVLCYWRDRVPDALDLLQDAGRRRASARPARGRPRRQLLHRARGDRGRPDLGRAADRRVPRLHPRRDDEGARPVLKKAIADGQPIALHERGRRPVLPPERQHRRAAEDEADAGRRSAKCSSARASATRSAARRWPTWRRLDNKSRADGAARRDPRQRRRRQGGQDESVVFDLARLLTGRRRPSWPPSRAELETAGDDGASTPVDAAARLTSP